MALEVELQVFDGPLDLLLNLIEKNKINIFDIPIVEITEQYLAYVRKLQTEDLSVMSEFMVMAAELIAIKCKMLLPKEVDEEGEEIDPRDELVRQLLEYKTYKYMSYALRDRIPEGTRRAYKEDTTPKEVRSYRPPVDSGELLKDMTLEKLHQIFHSVLNRQNNRIDPVRSKFGTIEKEEVSLDEKLQEVAAYTLKKKRVSFRKMISGGKSRTQIVVTFLAVLELMKYGLVHADQVEGEDDIAIEAVPGADLKDLPGQAELYDGFVS